MSPEKLSPLEFAKKAAEDSEAVLAGWNKEISDEKIVGKDEDPAVKTMEEVEREQAKKADEKVAENFPEEKITPKTKKEPPMADQEKLAEQREVPEKSEVRDYKAEIEKVVKEVEDARMKYAKEEYRTFNVVSKIKGILGIKVDSKKIDTVGNHYNNYQIKMNELLNLRLEEIKNSGLEGNDLKKEMGDLIKFFNFEEKSLNLYDAHTQARGQVWEEKFGKIPGKAAELAGKFINSYRKVNWKWKMIGSVALGATGIGAVALGVNRVVSGAATGVGVTGVLEARYRKKEVDKAEKQKEEILKKTESVDDKVSFLMEKLQIEIKDYGESLKTEKKKAFNRKAIGAAVAVFIGSGAMNWIIEISGGKQWLLEKLEYDNQPHLSTSSEHGMNPARVEEFGGVKPVTEASNAPEPPGGAVEGLEKNIELPEFPEGGSIEASIRDHFRANPDLIEKYNQFHGGGRNFSPGEIAHRMFAEYGDQRDLVHAGGRVILSPDGMSIKEVVDDNLGYLSEKESNLSNESPGDAPNELPPDSQNPKVEVIPEENDSWTDSRAKVEYVDDIKTSPESLFGKNSASILRDLDGQIAQNTEELSRSYMHSNEELEAIRERIADLGYSRGFMEKFSNAVLSGNQNEAVKSFRSAITLNENWERVKNMNFREAASQMNWRAGDKIKNVLKILGSSIGDEAKPRGVETLERWTERVVKLAVEKVK